ncbi:MAG TPA: hypothetical protein VF491_07300 [Vicinamibacterales bacterium]
MYAEFSYDVAPGGLPIADVLNRILEEFDLKPNGQERRRCDLLSDTFICEISSLNDFLAIDTALDTLRNDLQQQFHYTFSLRRQGTTTRIRSTHNEELADEIIDG